MPELPQLMTGIDLTPGLNALARKPFLEQQYQTGQMQSQLMQNQFKTAGLERELNVLKIGKEYLGQVSDKDDYVGYRDYMINEHGMNPTLLPEGFQSEEEFQTWKTEATLGAEELAKLRQGQDVDISRVNTDGTVSNLTVSASEFKRMADAKQLEGWKLGKITGTPEKTLDRIAQEEEIKSRYDKPTQIRLYPTAQGYLPADQAQGKMPSSGSSGPKDRPYITDLMSKGWVPSQRITTPLLDAYEAAAKKAAEDGNPLTPADLYEMEFNSQKNRSTGQSAGSRLSIARKQNVGTAFELLNDIETTGKALNYPEVKFGGMIEKWKNGQLNDPVFTEYMTQRADALFVLGNALKQNGLTDKSIEVEEEAFNPTMSPRALAAWANVQRRALNRVVKEMKTDYKYDDIEEVPTVAPGTGGGLNPQPAPQPDQPQNTATVVNPETGETEVWDSDTETRIK